MTIDLLASYGTCPTDLMSDESWNKARYEYVIQRIFKTRFPDTMLIDFWNLCFFPGPIPKEVRGLNSNYWPSHVKYKRIEIAKYVDDIDNWTMEHINRIVAKIEIDIGVRI